MTKRQNELLNDSLNNKELSQYDKKQLTERLHKFLEITNHNFNNDCIINYVGDESRTFHKIDQSKPLLSPSRILKMFIEHKFWRIPSKHLLRPRLMGQLVHKLIELRIMNKQIVKLDKENLIDYAGNDYAVIEKEWSSEKIDLFIEEVNEATNNIYNYLNLKGIKVLECEKHVADFNYHGYIDMVAVRTSKTNFNKIPMIIDLKITSNKEMIPDYLLQLAIYRQIYQKTAQCFILFYNRDTKEARLEKAQWAELDDIFEKIDTLVKIFRG